MRKLFKKPKFHLPKLRPSKSHREEAYPHSISENKEQDNETLAELNKLSQANLNIYKNLKLTGSLLAFICVVLVFALLRITAQTSIPIFLGFVFFAVLFPQAERLHRVFAIPYTLSCILVVSGFLLITLAFLYAVSISSFLSIAQSIPKYQEQLRELTQSTLQLVQNSGIKLEASQISNFVNNSAGRLGSILVSISSNVQLFLSQFLITLLMLLFLMLEGKRFFQTIQSVFSEARSRSIISIYRASVEQTSRYLLFKSLISLLTGSVITFGLWLFGVDFPVLWGLLATMLNFIPSIGSILHTLIVVSFSVLQFSHDLYFVIFIFLFLLCVQFLIGNYIEPKIFGRELKLSPVFILLSLFLWSYIWGITGMLIAVPILSVLKIFCQTIPSLRTFARFLEN